MPDLSVNYLAVLVAAVATWLIGALWYSPLGLGKAWMQANGYTPEKLQQMQATAARAYAVSFICYLVMAYVVAVLAHHVQVGSAMGGARLGVLCWLGFAATIGLTANVFSEKPLMAFVIDAGYQLVYLVAMGAIIGWWQ